MVLFQSNYAMSIESLYRQLHPKLFSIAYRLTGSVAESHDVVQEVWANYLQVATTIESPEKYLARSISNRSLNFIEKQKFIREHYKGIYLPEPVCYPQLSFEIEEDISFSLFMLLEKLSPIERAIFVLHESFDFDYQELSEIFNIKPETCRQHLHRAKEHLQKERKRFSTSIEHRKRFVEFFRTASQNGKLEDLINLLKSDVICYTDGGGKVSSALKPIFGKENNAKFLAGISKKGGANLISVFAEINGFPGFISYDKTTHQLDTVMLLECDELGVATIFMVRNPEKLHGIVTDW